VPPFGVKVNTPIWDKALQTSGSITQTQSPVLRALYAPLIAFYQHDAERDVASPLEHVLQAIDQALCSQNPRAHSAQAEDTHHL